MLALSVILTALAGAQESRPLRYQAGTYEYIRGEVRDTIFITGGAKFWYENWEASSDTAIWIKGERIVLLHEAMVKDTAYELYADSIDYQLNRRNAYARGDSVIIISQADSVRAVGTNAFYSRDSGICRMYDRPTVYLNYQDTAQITHIFADQIALETENKIAYADGNVLISQNKTKSESGRAIMYLNDDILLLMEGVPVARRDKSEIRGDTLVFLSEYDRLKQIHVYNNAWGYFKEPSQTDSNIFDVSELKAQEIEFNLDNDQLDNILASGQAYSFYFPAVKDSTEIVKNTVSGDTLKLYMDDGGLSSVHVIGGAEGEYLTGTYREKDTTSFFAEDTVRYRSSLIDYAINDSTIVLRENAHIQNKNVTLSADRVDYNTASELVFAYDDSLMVDSSMEYIPVVLNDGSEEIIGSYLEYSFTTEKGMIRQSKTDYQEAYYGGKELFRKEKEVYYVDGGTYTSCNINEPHFHFRSSRMKMIQDDKIMARPVVFYIEKVPLFIIPYYVFPTKPGRHSGFLSFKFGNFQRGRRFLSNVGYYWAASEYWDLTTAIDYYEDFGIKYRTAVQYRARYKFNGSLTGEYANDSRYIGFNKTENKRWRFIFNHSQTISPTFDIKASGTFLSDKSYYTDFSTDLEDRLNRNLKSQISLSKRFKSASLSAQFLHEVALDQEARTDNLPSARLSLSSRPVFGTPEKDEEGNINLKWYHKIYTNYSVALKNYSRRTTDVDTGLRSRKKYATIDHHSSLSASFNILKYLKMSPSVRLQETWYKVFESDQSLAAGIDASETYRRFAYGASLGASTDLYGTVYPGLFALEGIRHVMTPSVSFSWSPEITRHDNIKSFTGAGGGGARARVMSMSLKHIFQAKVKSGESSKKLTLFTITSNLSYNFEAEERKFSQLRTSASTSLLKNLHLQASMTHDLYRPGTNELNLWSPYLQNLTISTRFNTSGTLGEYGAVGPQEASQKGSKTGGKQRWTFSATHHYSESGREQAFNKQHTVNFNLNADLTPSLNMSYSQTYHFHRHKTVSRRLNLSKNLHCWQGKFSWNIDGSNSGFYFIISVIAIPDIKFEKSQSDIRGPFSF